MSENKSEIRGMNLHYGDFHALHDIDTDIKSMRSRRLSARPAAANRRCSARLTG